MLDSQGLSVRSDDLRNETQSIAQQIVLQGPNSHLTAQRLSDVLEAENSGYKYAIRIALTRLPTIRVVEPGTFMEYRRWRGEKMKIGLGQVKAPSPKDGYWRGSVGTLMLVYAE